MDANPLTAKLSAFMDVGADEARQIVSWCRLTRRLRPRATVVNEDSWSTDTCILLEGWAYRYKDDRSGQRQIVGLMLPGDTCDLHSFLLEAPDHSIATAEGVTAAFVPGEQLRRDLAQFPRLAEAFWWSSLLDTSIGREWLLNVGARNAELRLANLICELWTRANRVGLATDTGFDLPLNQAHLGEALGLTSVHVNRTLRTLREKGLLTVRKGRAELDYDRLAKFSGFRPAYLHLHAKRREVDLVTAR